MAFVFSSGLVWIICSLKWLMSVAIAWSALKFLVWPAIPVPLKAARKEEKTKGLEGGVW